MTPDEWRRQLVDCLTRNGSTPGPVAGTLLTDPPVTVRIHPATYDLEDPPCPTR